MKNYKNKAEAISFIQTRKLILIPKRELCLSGTLEESDLKTWKDDDHVPYNNKSKCFFPGCKKGFTHNHKLCDKCFAKIKLRKKELENNNILKTK